jgi:hypothetical protein
MMGFGFRYKSDVEHQVRRMAEEQLDKAIADTKGGDFDEAVHSVRRRCKRLRGLLRLIRPTFSHYNRENKAIRDAADRLSGARDAAAVIETFGDLRSFGHKQGNHLQPALADAVAVMLENRADKPSHTGGQVALLAELRSALDAVRKRVEDWSVEREGFNALEQGLVATYARMRKRMDRARKDNSAISFHDWRKDTKYHWHHVGMLQAAAPDLLGHRKELLNQLGTCLGDHHNLFVLGEVLEKERGPIARNQVSTVQAAISERQSELAKQAFLLGEQLAAEKPQALGDRFHAYWQLLPERG